MACLALKDEKFRFHPKRQGLCKGGNYPELLPI